MRSRLRSGDLVRVASAGLRSRPGRTALSVLGVAIGIAAVVSVLGITRSSQSEVLAQIDRLGTNLLTVSGGKAVTGQEARLPVTAGVRVARTEGVSTAAATATLDGVSVYRNDLVPPGRTGGLSVRVADPVLLGALDGELTAGRFLDGALISHPVAVLGHAAAEALGVGDLSGRPRVYLGGHWYTVGGTLAPIQLAPELDVAALIGAPVAGGHFGYDGTPTRIYVRTDPEHTAVVAALLARAAAPAHPEEVAVSNPSDALEARLRVTGGATVLFLALGAVALLVGGIGIANVLVISVLERRGEIGLRRALGATRRHVAAQFLVESLLLGVAGGVAGVLSGAAATYAFALSRGWQPLVPAPAVAAGLAVAVVIGGCAGLYPAVRAARQPLVDALRSP